MKKYLLISHVLLLLVLLFMVQTHTGCQDPHDFEPPPDTMVPPPNMVPELISPPNDTGFIYKQDGHGSDTIWVLFIWDIVPQAQYYDLEVSTDTTFNAADAYHCAANSQTVVMPEYGTGWFFWRVRAGSDYWTWYTGWSDVWRIRLAYPPF
ncbi:hypothetical protein JXB22_03770 [candidate division WOR-3 bacterium]|nr:hypothetical protein [candidate division WOR-3 bacterium]